jgi:hypothetical protein
MNQDEFTPRRTAPWIRQISLKRYEKESLSTGGFVNSLINTIQYHPQLIQRTMHYRLQFLERQRVNNLCKAIFLLIVALFVVVMSSDANAEPLTQPDVTMVCAPTLWNAMRENPVVTIILGSLFFYLTISQIQMDKMSFNLQLSPIVHGVLSSSLEFLVPFFIFILQTTIGFALLPKILSAAGDCYKWIDIDKNFFSKIHLLATMYKGILVWCEGFNNFFFPSVPVAVPFAIGTCVLVFHSFIASLFEFGKSVIYLSLLIVILPVTVFGNIYQTFTNLPQLVPHSLSTKGNYWCYSCYYQLLLKHSSQLTKISKQSLPSASSTPTTMTKSTLQTQIQTLILMTRTQKTILF